MLKILPKIFALINTKSNLNNMNGLRIMLTNINKKIYSHASTKRSKTSNPMILLIIILFLFIINGATNIQPIIYIILEIMIIQKYLMKHYLNMITL